MILGSLMGICWLLGQPRCEWVLVPQFKPLARPPLDLSQAPCLASLMLLFVLHEIALAIVKAIT